MKNVFFFLVLSPWLAFAQPTQQPHSGQIKLRLKKLNFLGSVLYMAAHPDDENTRIITYLSNERLATTAYLSLTRGDGGQNLIGAEIRDQLGVIRTQELLAARRIDGGQQFFTRANDFGFSKSSDETFAIWGKDSILSDAIRVFRQYQPDVIITRFPPTKDAGHGHHTASAMLAHEAFDKAADPTIFPAQAKALGLWQPRRVYTNTGRWWNKDINEKTPGVITLDVGGYNTLLGKSYTEIAAMSSSQHKSQGWGQSGVRGYLPEFLEHQKGDRAEKDIFEGVNTSWSRVKGGDKVKALVDEALRVFDPEKPQSLIPHLLKIRRQIQNLEAGVWKTRKLQETEQLLQDCLGLFVEATSQHFQGTPGQPVRTSLEVINRATGAISLDRISSSALQWDTTFTAALQPNVKMTIRTKPVLASSLPYTQPYWLAEPHDLGLFSVSDQRMIGLPEASPAIQLTFQFTVEGESFVVTKPLIYKWTDPVKGELWRPFEIVPPVFINPVDRVMIFDDEMPGEVKYLLKATGPAVRGTLQLKVPSGWRAEPETISFEFNKTGEELLRSFRLIPPSSESKGSVQAIATIDGQVYDKALQYIQYDHIPVQSLMPPAKVDVVKMNLRKEGERVAYIKGAGDEIPAALRNIGYQVWEMKNDEVTLENLKKVDAVVLGIRALNTNERIRYFMGDLLEYVKQGGTLVMQYNTNFDLEVETFSPFPLKLSRERVTQEDAPVRILKPEHNVFNTPNKIDSRDFAGWVQERGLYFPNQWDPAFEALLSMNDKDEPAREGSLLVAKHGSGYYVYTSLSFFRELPEGVPGAYKLFANLLSLGKTTKTESGKPKGKVKAK